MARPVGAPPRLTEPPRPWKKAIGTPHSRPRRVRRSWVLASSQLDERKPPSLFESEYPIMTSNTPPCARALRRTSGTCSSSRTTYGLQGQGTGRMPGFGERPDEPALYYINDGNERDAGPGMLPPDLIAEIVKYE